MLSPVQAPIHAARPSRMIEGDPEVDHREASVTMVDSLGTDGKKPSNAAKRYTTRCTHHASAKDRTHPSAISVRDSNQDRKSTRLNSSHVATSYAVFCL